MRLSTLLLTIALMTLLFVFATSTGCSDLDAEPSTTDADSDGDSDGDADFDTSVLEDQTVGSSCTCIKDSCYQFDVPIPNADAILGCDEVPSDWTGADPVCLRTYDGDDASPTYFANGYCALMGAKCTDDSPDNVICSKATIGDHAAFVSCPPGHVLVSFQKDVEALGGSLTATIENKVCARGCTDASECRNDETDPELTGSPATEYDCIVDTEGVKFCYDPRNLATEYTATAF